jgi:siroheme synthase
LNAVSRLIPLTHRGDGRTVTVVTGYHDRASPDCTLDCAVLARLPTVIFYVAVRHGSNHSYASRAQDGSRTPAGAAEARSAMRR